MSHMPKHTNRVRCHMKPRHPATANPVPIPTSPTPMPTQHHCQKSSPGVQHQFLREKYEAVYTPPCVYPWFIPIGYKSKGGCDKAGCNGGWGAVDRAGDARGGGGTEVVSGVVYLASPYSHRLGRVREARYRVVMAVAAGMIRQGMCVYSPIVYSHQMAGAVGGDWGSWRVHDLGMLAVSSVVCVLCLEGWKESEGVRREIEAAVSLGIRVQYMFPIGYKSKG